MRTREAIGPGSIGRRLLVSIVLVLVAAAATAWLVATLVGPALFHEHLVQANIADHELADLHIEEAFQSASTIALGLAMVVAGGGSYFKSMGLEKLFRDIQGARFHPLPDGPQRRLAGRVALGLPIDD